MGVHGRGLVAQQCTGAEQRPRHWMVHAPMSEGSEWVLSQVSRHIDSPCPVGAQLCIARCRWVACGIPAWQVVWRGHLSNTVGCSDVKAVTHGVLGGPYQGATSVEMSRNVP